MYLDHVMNALKSNLGQHVHEELIRFYALLVLAKGEATTREDIHNAWSLWTAVRNADHKSLIPYGRLSSDMQELDQPFVDAVISACQELDVPRSAEPDVTELLNDEVKYVCDGGTALGPGTGDTEPVFIYAHRHIASVIAVELDAYRQAVNEDSLDEMLDDYIQPSSASYHKTEYTVVQQGVGDSQ